MDSNIYPTVNMRIKKWFEHFPFCIWYLNYDVVYPCHWFIIFLFYSLIVFGIDLYELNRIHIVHYVDKAVFIKWHLLEINLKFRGCDSGDIRAKFSKLNFHVRPGPWVKILNVIVDKHWGSENNIQRPFRCIRGSARHSKTENWLKLENEYHSRYDDMWATSICVGV